MFDIEKATIRAIHRAYAKKEISVRELTASYFERIAGFRKKNADCRAILELNPDAFFIADQLDSRLRQGDTPGPMFGIPVLLKDNINTADKMHTSAGSLALADHHAASDAAVVTKLRDAGALILGKTSMTEFANYMSRQGMPDGYSSRGGQVLSPFNRESTPGGSSSGSAVAVALGFCPAAVGTETSGSIIHPSWHNGIVGIKPTQGLVGQGGIVPISHTLDTAGPMGRTVEDAAALLWALAGGDPRGADGTARKKDGAGIASLTNLRIGINNPEFLEEEQTGEEKKIFQDFCRILREAGAVLVEDIRAEGDRAIEDIMKYEFKNAMNFYLAGQEGRTSLKTLADIIAFNQRQGAALKYGQDLFLAAQEETSGTLTETDYLEALLIREGKIRELDGLLRSKNLDVLLCGGFTNLAPFTGFPSLTLPIGQKENRVPLGSYWTAGRFEEAKLIKIAAAVEELLSLTVECG